MATFQYHLSSVIPSGDWIWVFGSNIGGNHTRGASRIARDSFGAAHGCGIGPSGQSYAIPTIDDQFNRLPLSQIALHVANFIRFAAEQPERSFFVTDVGCDRSGPRNHRPADMAMLFADVPAHCSLPEAWRPFILKPRKTGDFLPSTPHHDI